MKTSGVFVLAAALMFVAATIAAMYEFDRGITPSPIIWAYMGLAFANAFFSVL